MTRYRERPLGEGLTQVEDVVPVDLDREYATLGVRSYGRGLFRRPTLQGSETRYKQFFRVRAGQFVYSKLFAWEGALGVVGDNEDGLYVSQEFPTFDIEPDVFDVGYVRHLAAWPELHNQLHDRTTGLGNRRQRVNADQLLATPVPCPDVDEQRRISAKLDSLFRIAIDTERRTAVAERNIEHLRERSLGEIYERFCSELRPVSDIGTIVRGRGGRYDEESSHMALNQACVRWGGVELAHARRVDPSWDSSVPESHRAQYDDVLVNSTGEGTIGRACQVTTIGLGLPFDSHILAVRVDGSIVRPDFLALMMQTPQVQSALQSAKGASTTKQTELGKRKLEQLWVPAPASLAVQGAICRRVEGLLSAAGRAARTAKRRAELLRGLRLSLLNAAFSGRL